MAQREEMNSEGSEEEREKEMEERERERERGTIYLGRYLIIIQDIRNLIKTTPPECSHKERGSSVCSSA